MLPGMYIAAYFEDANGYGHFTNNIVRHMVERGIKVHLTPLHGSLPPADLMPFLWRGPEVKMHDIIFTSISNNPSEIKARVIFTMSETREVPWEYGRDLARFKHVIVPTKYSAAAVKKWNKKVSICPLGTDMHWESINFSPFTFVAVATDHFCPERKRIQELTDTFSKTFRRESDVRLILKRSADCIKINTFDNRVSIITTDLSREAYKNVIVSATVGVQPSLMEGWSLPVNEFMAAGRPVITGLAGAIGDYLTPEAAFPVDYKFVRAPRPVFLGKGMIPYADMEMIGQQMRFAYENRFEVVKRGIAAYEAAQKFTKHSMGENFLNIWQTLSS